MGLEQHASHYPPSLPVVERSCGKQEGLLPLQRTVATVVVQELQEYHECWQFRNVGQPGQESQQWMRTWENSSSGQLREGSDNC